MADSFIRLPVDGLGKLVDTSQLTVGANTVQRERMIIGDNTANNFVAVSATGGALVDQGAAAALAAAWPVEITDGTNVLGVSAHPVRIDPTGTTIQPVSWTSQTVTVTQGTGTNLHVVVDSGVITVSGTVSTKTALTASAPAAATVGVTSATAVASNSSRKGLVLINTSANTISLGFGSAAVLASGITLNPNGGTFVMDEFTFSTAAVTAIASGASSNLSVEEYA